MSSSLRPSCAAQYVSANTATPSRLPPSTSGRPGIAITLRTPGTRNAAAEPTLTTFAPTTGARWMTATSIPGNCTSMLYLNCPQTLAAASRLCRSLPMYLNCDGSFSVTLSGAGRCAATPTSSP